MPDPDEPLTPDPGDSHPMDGAAIRAYLTERGATGDDIARAEQEGWLPLLALDRALMPGERRYDVRAITAAAGTDEVFARELWRALGFPDVPSDLQLFTDDDLVALRRLLARIPPRSDRGIALHQARVISASMARVAAVEAEAIAALLEVFQARGASQEECAAQLLSVLDWSDIEALLDYVHRLQLRAAVWRHLAREGLSGVEVAVGFVDLAGYTALSEQLEPAQLVELVNRWEALAYDTVARYGGRVVKTIGDEVMIVGLARDVAHIAIALRNGAAADPLLSEVRAGIASGEVLARDGDYYGPVVNLASRIAGTVERGQIVASAALHAVLAGEPTLRWEPIGTRHLHGIGDVDLWRMEGAGPE